MKLDKNILGLYAVSQRYDENFDQLLNKIEQVLSSGVKVIQLREKNLDYENFVTLAKKAKSLCNKYDAYLIINDEVEVAIAVNAHGVHIGQSDQKLIDVRKKLGNDKIIGVSVHNLAETIEAKRNGADYLGVGAIFTTNTKDDANDVSLETLKEIVDNVDISVVAIGGIDQSNINKFAHINIDGVAVVSAIFNNSDIKKSIKQLQQQINKYL